MSGGKFSKTFFCLPRWTRKQTESWPLRWLQSRAGFCRLRKVEAGAAGWQSNVRRLLGYERSVLPNHPPRHIRRKNRTPHPRSRWRRRSSNGSDDARPAHGLRLTAVDDYGTDFVRNLNLCHCSVQECVFDFHNVSFPLEAAPSGRDTKRAGGHDGLTGRQHLQEGMAKHGGYIEFKKSLWGFRFSMYPAASNAHLKALRLNLVGLLAPRVYKVFQTFEKNKRRPGHSAPHKGEAKSWPSCSSADDLYFVCITLHERGFPLGKPWC